MTNIFSDIAFILATTTVLAAIFARFKQPVMLSYLLVGVLAATGGLFTEVRGETLNLFAELGIALTLFLVGLELRFSEIKQIGRAAIAVGLGQIVFTWAFGLLLSYYLLKFDLKEALVLSLALTFSSTIIVVKLLVEKRDLHSLYGKITAGYLIVQDFVAIAALILITSLAGGGGASFFTILLKGFFGVGLILVLNRFVLQSLFDIFAKNSEVLFLAGVSWALVFAVIFALLGFSIEIGSFLAGLGLARLREQAQIAAWVRPLRNLFIAIFFVSLGFNLSLNNLSLLAKETAILSLFVLLGNPAIMLVILGALGFRRRTSFQTALTSGQVSEFSLILVALAAGKSLVDSQLVVVVSAVALVTIVLSTYLIGYSARLYRVFAPYLRIFERKTLVEQPFKPQEEFKDHIVLVGAGRLGWNILRSLHKKGQMVLVVDFDPEVVKRLEEENIPVIYGDVSDPEIFEKALGKNPKMIISTVFDNEDTERILQEAKNLPEKVPLIVTASDKESALAAYRLGATYVIIPRILSSHMIERVLFTGELSSLIDGTLRKEHLEELKQPVMI